MDGQAVHEEDEPRRDPELELELEREAQRLYVLSPLEPRISARGRYDIETFVVLHATQELRERDDLAFDYLLEDLFDRPNGERPSPKKRRRAREVFRDTLGDVVAALPPGHRTRLRISLKYRGRPRNLKHRAMLDAMVESLDCVTNGRALRLAPDVLASIRRNEPKVEDTGPRGSVDGRRGADLLRVGSSRPSTTSQGGGGR